MRSRVVMLVIALVIAGVAAVMAAQYLDSARTRIEVETEPIEVLVATQPIPRGMSAEELVERELIVTREIPREFVNADAVSSARAIEGQVLADPLAEGEQVTRARFQYPSQAGLAYSIPEGYVAVSVPNDEVKGVGGLVKPGDHVVVLVTFKPGPDGIEPLTRILFSKVRVLAIGTALGAETSSPEGTESGNEGVLGGDRSSGAQAGVPSTLTLALSPADVEKLVYAESNGEVWLALHATTDADVPATSGRTLQDIFQ